ncbi:type I secretion C-terminal target domain-containing protein [Sinorhizobium medicae]|nr:type I secretion C-terminal target domain-containing protein [Sinorhizobium medicae]
MTIITETDGDLFNFANIDYTTFVASYSTGTYIAAQFYSVLAAQASGASLPEVSNYAARVKNTVENSEVKSQIENQFLERVSTASGTGDASVGSALWHQYQYERMKSLFSALKDDIDNGGEGSLDFRQINEAESAAAGLAGLPAEAVITNIPLSHLPSTYAGDILGQAAFNNFNTPEGDVLPLIPRFVNSAASLASDIGAIYTLPVDFISGAIPANEGMHAKALWAKYFTLAFQDVVEIMAYEEEIEDLEDFLEDIHEEIGVAEQVTGPVADWLENIGEILGEGVNSLISSATGLIKDALEIAGSTASPLIFDLGGNNAIDLSAFADGNITFFDLDNDGFAERTGWVDATDGLLVYDQNDNGQIENTTEWFGTKDIDGFTVLAAYDSNSDGRIDQEDAIWSDLQIWQDADEDGIADDGELAALGDHNIIRINLDAVAVEQTNEGHPVSHTGTFVVDNGVSGPVSRIVHDVWFNYDDVASRYAQSYTFDMRAAYLPTLRGYGELPDLHIAMSLDNDGSGNLLELVTNFYALGFADLAEESTIDAVQAIMFRWAGVDSVSSSARGSYIDARQLEFLEKMMGTPFIQDGIGSNPAPNAARELEEAFFKAQNFTMARLLVQSEVADLFEGDFFYNLSTDSFEGITGLSETTLDALETLASGLSTGSEQETFWTNIIQVIEQVVGIDNLSGGDLTLLETAIYDSAELDFAADLINRIVFGNAEQGDEITGDVYANTLNGTSLNDLISGGSGNDTISGGAGFDQISGDSGDDLLFGGDGHDTIHGNHDDDEITGGLGGDYMLGGYGEDTYFYNLGDGNDFIQEQYFSDTDRIVMGSGIIADHITLERSGTADLVITIDTGSSVSRITLLGHFYSGTGDGHVELIEFSDTSTMALDGLTWPTYGTSAGETIYGMAGGGGSSNDLIYGEGGADSIYAGVGNDTVHGGSDNDLIYGATGNDTVYGYGGDDRIYGEDDVDTLYGGDGADDIRGGGGADSLHGGANSSGLDYLFGGDGNDNLEGGTGHDRIYGDGGTDNAIYATNSTNFIVYRASSTEYRVKDTNDTSSNGYGEDRLVDVEYIVFNDITLDVAALGLTVGGVAWGSASPINGTSGNDTISGYSSNDIIYGAAGNDTISAAAGNDVLYGEDGTDTLNGQDGDDILSGGAGNDALAGGDGSDSYVFNGTWNADTVTETAGTDKILIQSGLTASDIYIMSDSSKYLIIGNKNDSSTIKIITTFTANVGVSLSPVELIEFDNGTTINLAAALIMEGTSSGNIFHGYAAGDTMYGYGGNDSFNGYDGNDLIYGGDGADTIAGGDDNDTLYGDADVDTINGNDGNDVIFGGDGADTIYGDNNNDTIAGGAGNDTISGGSGDDIYDVSGSWGTDTITDSAGTDKIRVGSSLTISDFWIVSAGTTALHIVSKSDSNNRTVITTSSNADGVISPVELVEFDNGTTLDLTGAITWEGNSGNNEFRDFATAGTMYGYAGTDTFYGYDGNDIMYGGDGNDTMYGGDDNDTMYGDANDDIMDGQNGDDTLYGGAGVDAVTGGAGNDVLYGGDGNDTLQGGDNDDALYGDAGNDAANGGNGNDIYYASGAWGTDTITDSAGTDKIRIGGGLVLSDFWIVSASATALHIVSKADSNNRVIITTTSSADGVITPIELVEFDSGPSLDLTAAITMEGNSGANTFHGFSHGDVMNGYEGVDTFYGYDGNDTMYGGDGNDVMNGGDDSDTIYGGNDNDTINGDAGSDTLHGDAGNDTTSGGAGDDLYVYSTGLDTVTDTAGTDTIQIGGSTTINDISFSNVSTYNTKITISSGTNEITVTNLRHGTASNHVDFIKFADGFVTSLPDYASWLNGTSGNDTVAGNGSDNTLVGFAGNDNMTGGSGNDDMHGGAGNDTLDGDDGTDLLYGGDGTDILYGEGGLDTLHGGAGADTFKLHTASAFNNVDVIKDFSTAQADIIDLTDILGAAYNPLTDAIADFVSFSESSGSTFVSVDRDGTGGVYSMAQIIKLENVTGLASAETLETNGNLLAA